MGDITGIEWTNRTWNPWHGCEKVSPGCKNCYMYREKARYGQDPRAVVRSKTTFNAPLKWPQEPQLCFTCSWSDFFIREADGWREEAYEVMRRTPWITYQVLTKRIERVPLLPNPKLSNMWLGVSVENAEYKSRIDLLRCVNVPLRFLSLEPLLGDLGRIDLSGIGWVIVGGESGSGARPVRAEWVRSIRDQCIAAKVPFFFKQWGEHLPAMTDGAPLVKRILNCGDVPIRVGKKAAGRSLDGRTWDEFPAIAQHAPGAVA